MEDAMDKNHEADLRKIRDVVVEEHARIQKVLDQLGATSSADIVEREQGLARLQAELEAHHTYEHEVLYPCLRSCGARAFVEYAEKQHSLAEQSLTAVKDLSPTTLSWTATFADLDRILRAHMRREEEVIDQGAD